MTTKSFIAGALACWVVIFLIGFLGTGLLLTSEFQAIFAGADLESQGAEIFVLHTLTRLLSGFAAFAVFVLCTRIWPGTKALFAAVAIVWTLLYLPALVLFHDLGLLGLAGNIKIGAFGVVEIALAVLAGGFVARKV